MRIAVASSNGEDLDVHFGKAHSLYVYEYDAESDEFKFIDQRNVEIEADMKHQNPKIIKSIGLAKFIELGGCTPPIIVVALENDLSTWDPVDPRKIRFRFLQAKGP
mgnify:CR=1 FL=1